MFPNDSTYNPNPARTKKHPRESVRISVAKAEPPPLGRFGAGSREADELGIPRPPVGADVVRLEPGLHVRLPRVVKLEPPLLHNLEDLPLALVVEAGAPIARVDVRRQVEGAARETGLDIAGKAVGEARVDVVGAGEVYFGDAGDPEVSGEVEGRRDEEEEDGDAKEKEHDGFACLGGVAKGRMERD